jgi:hypothetical protein
MKGTVYILESDSTNLKYIGSTTKGLMKRLRKHKSDYKQYLKGKEKYRTSFEIIKYGDYTIKSLQEVQVENLKQLRRQIRAWKKISHEFNQILI